ncbi:hypothetical protein HYW75_00090 [Candidatus Pacearchaeota archaeon]|nr:hypothetical protein [Candidatus Pacearchaeota archaeon]
MVTKINPAQMKQIVKEVGSPAFIYIEATISDNIARVRRAISNSGIQNKVNLYVSYFANSNPHIAAILANEEVGLTLQSIEENEQLEAHNLKSIPRIVSSTHLSRKDLEYFLKGNLQVNYATLSNLEEALKRGVNNLSIRVDLSPDSNQRQGIKPEQFNKVCRILNRNNRKLCGIHIYPGTKNKLEVHLRYQVKGLECLSIFQSLKEINLGGGFNYDYELVDGHFDWASYFIELKKRIDEFKVPKDIIFSIEPGRDILADTGLLIVQVNGIEKIVGKSAYEVFTDGSYVQMPSATIGQRQHRLSFYNSRFQEIICGLINEKAGYLSGNTTLSSDRLFPGIVYFPSSLKEGDYIILEDVGAYCATQHMDFLNKSSCPEAIIRKNGSLELITERGKMTDKIRNVLQSPWEIGGRK